MINDHSISYFEKKISAILLGSSSPQIKNIPFDFYLIFFRYWNKLKLQCIFPHSNLTLYWQINYYEGHSQLINSFNIIDISWNNLCAFRYYIYVHRDIYSMVMELQKLGCIILSASLFLRSIEGAASSGF